MNDSTPSLVDLYNLKQEYGADNHYSISDSNVAVTSNSGEVVNTLSVSDIPKSTTSYESTESTNNGDNLRDRGYSSSMDGYSPPKSNKKANTITPNVVKASQLNKGAETDSGTGNAEAGAKAGILASDITKYEEPKLSYDARIDESHDNSAYWSEHREEQRRMEAEASLERIEELKTIAEGKQKAADEQAEKFKVCGNIIGSDTEPDDNSVDLRDPNYNELDSTEKAYGEAAAATQAYLTAIEKYKQEYGDLNLETDLDTGQKQAEKQLDAAIEKQYKVRNTSAVIEEVNHNLTQLFGGTTYHEDGSKTVKDGNTEYHYDKDGNLLSTVERDKDGNILNIHPEEASALPSIQTQVFEDGSKTVIINGTRYNYDTDGVTLLSIANEKGLVYDPEKSKLGQLLNPSLNHEPDPSKYKEYPNKGFSLWLSDNKYSMEDFAESKLAKEFGFETPEQALEAFVAVIISESNKSLEDVLAITSVILNRCDLYENWYNGYGYNNPFDQLFYINEDGTPQFQAIIRDEYGEDNRNNPPRYLKYMPSFNENGKEGVDELVKAAQKYSESYTQKTGETEPEKKNSYDELKEVVYDALFGGLRNNAYSCYYSNYSGTSSPDNDYRYANNNAYNNQDNNASEYQMSGQYKEQLGMTGFEWDKSYSHGVQSLGNVTPPDTSTDGIRTLYYNPNKHRTVHY